MATRALFLATMLIAGAAFAGNDVNRCVAPSGLVTLTDEACPADTETVKVSNGTDDSAGASAPARQGIEHYTLPRMPARHAAPLRTSAPSRGLALDVLTLKMAHDNLQLFSPSRARAPRLASLP